MAKPKQQKLLKLPKKPKNKTIASMQKYLDGLDRVSKENNRRMNKYKADLKKWESLKNRVSNA